MDNVGISAFSEQSPHPPAGWLTQDQASVVRDTRLCPDCSGRMALAVICRLPLKPAFRRCHLRIHFNNVLADGKVTRGGLELYYCGHCPREFAFGPRVGTGGYRMLRMP